MVDIHDPVSDRSRLGQNVLCWFAGVNGQAAGLAARNASPEKIKTPPGIGRRFDSENAEVVDDDPTPGGSKFQFL
jgi:hypothetical protein